MVLKRRRTKKDDSGSIMMTAHANSTQMLSYWRFVPSILCARADLEASVFSCFLSQSHSKTKVRMRTQQRWLTFGIWISCLCKEVRSQASPTPSLYASLSPSPFLPSVNGTFTWPKGATTGIFTEGITMNISWTTDFPGINLWLIVNQTWDRPTPLVSMSQGRMNEGNTSY